jgi:hypothetical protein
MRHDRTNYCRTVDGLSALCLINKADIRGEYSNFDVSRSAGAINRDFVWFRENPKTNASPLRRRWRLVHSISARPVATATFALCTSGHVLTLTFCLPLFLSVYTKNLSSSYPMRTCKLFSNVFTIENPMADSPIPIHGWEERLGHAASIA